MSLPTLGDLWFGDLPPVMEAKRQVTVERRDGQRWFTLRTVEVGPEEAEPDVIVEAP